MAAEGNGLVAFADRHLTAEQQKGRSVELAKMLRRTGRWARVDWCAEKLSASPPQVCAVIAGDRGCRYVTGAWYGDFWVREASTDERRAARTRAADAEAAATAGQDPPLEVMQLHAAAVAAMAEDNRGP